MIDRAALLAAIERLAAAMEREAAALNEIDGALGDGDLGITVTRGMQAVSAGVADMPTAATTRAVAATVPRRRRARGRLMPGEVLVGANNMLIPSVGASDRQGQRFAHRDCRLQEPRT